MELSGCGSEASRKLRAIQFAPDHGIQQMKMYVGNLTFHALRRRAYQICATSFSLLAPVVQSFKVSFSGQKPALITSFSVTA